MATAEPSTRDYKLQPKLATGARLAFNEDLHRADEEFSDFEKGFHHVDHYYFFESVKCEVDKENTEENYFFEEDVDGDGNPMMSRLWLWDVLHDAPWSTCTSFLHIGCYTGYLNFVAAFCLGPNKVNHGLETNYKSFLRCRRRANEINACFPKLREKISFPRFFNCHYSELQPHRRYSFIVCSCETTMEDRNAIINSLLELGGTLVTLREKTGEITRGMVGNANFHVPIDEREREQPLSVSRSQKKDPKARVMDLMEVPSLFELSASAVSEAIMRQIPIEDEDCNYILADISLALNSQTKRANYVREEVDELRALLDRLCLPSTSNVETMRIFEKVTFKIKKFWACVFHNDIFVTEQHFLEEIAGRLARIKMRGPDGQDPSEFKTKHEAIVQAMVDRSSPDFQNRWEKYVSNVKKLQVHKVIKKYHYKNIDLTRILT